jgi:hypothetical protein
LPGQAPRTPNSAEKSPPEPNPQAVDVEDRLQKAPPEIAEPELREVALPAVVAVLTRERGSAVLAGCTGCTWGLVGGNFVLRGGSFARTLLRVRFRAAAFGRVAAHR